MMESECCCRICLRAEVGQEMISIHCKRNKETIATMLMDCGDVMVLKHDDLPERVCMRCLDRLEEAYNLRKLIKQSDLSLRKMTKKYVKIKPLIDKEVLENKPIVNNEHSIQSKSANFPTAEQIEKIVAKDTYSIIYLKGLRCCGCKMIFDSPKQLKQHSVLTHQMKVALNDGDSSIFQCSNCHECFPNRMKLLNHTQTFQFNAIYHCTQCDITFDIEYRLQQHQSLSKAHRNKPSNSATGTTAASTPKKPGKIRNRTVGRKRVTKELKYPDQQNIIGVDETAEYQVIYIGGERCCGCENIFANLQELNDHCNKIHHKSKEKASFECNMCYETFDQIQSFNRHNSARKHKQLYFCKLCNLVVDVRFRFEQHLKTSVTHQNALDKGKIEPSALPEECSPNEIRSLEACISEEKVESVRCCGCNYYCTTREELEQHSEEKHAVTHASTDATEPHECEVCFKGFNSSELLMYHQNAALQTIVYKCKFCDVRSEIKYRVMQHIASGVHEDFARTERPIFEPEQKSFNCCFVKCSLVFIDSNELLEHVESVHASKRRENAEEREHKEFICYVCHKSFRNEKSLHIHQFPRKAELQHVCSNCGSGFANISALNAHEKIHIGLREFQCEVCEKAFFDERTLRVHKVCHNAERPYVCNVCDKSFLRKGNLKVHKRCHAESIWDCPHCDEKFKTKQSLVLHVRYHTGEKPYQCRYCSNRYSHTTDRQRHEMAAHTMVRPHKCTKCPAAFIRKRQLTIHERIHTGDRPYVCHICHKRFIQKSNLMKHLSLHEQITQLKNEEQETNYEIEMVDVEVEDGEYLVEEVCYQSGADDASDPIEKNDDIL